MKLYDAAVFSIHLLICVHIFLLLGNERDAANLQRLKDLGITYVLNVTSHLPQHFENHGIKYKRLPASDSGQQNLRQYFEEAGSFIGKQNLKSTMNLFALISKLFVFGK